MIDIGNKFIHAGRIDNINNKPAFEIINNRSGAAIACVNWYPAWKRYVMTVDTPAAFDMGCLQDIIKFIEKQSKD